MLTVYCRYWPLQYWRFCSYSNLTKFTFQTTDYSPHGDQKIESAQKIHASRGWCEMHTDQFWWAWPLQYWRFAPFLIWPNFPFGPWIIIVHGGQKIKSAQIIYASRARLMWNACKPISMSMASPAMVILLLFCLPSKMAKFPFGLWTIVHGGQRIESAQKIQVELGWCEIHANQFWWAWPLWFRRFCSFSFSFNFWTIDFSPLGQKMKLAQKIHSLSGSWWEMLMLDIFVQSIYVKAFINGLA